MGCMINDLVGFHCWLRHGDLIFDPSVGDWHSLDAVASAQIAFGKSFPPVQWTVALPSYWLKPAAELELPRRPIGEPTLDEAWYEPFRGGRLAAVRRIGTAHETSIEAFGPDRCTFESNFPPDKGQCSYQTIFNAFKGIAFRKRRRPLYSPGRRWISIG